MRYQQKLRSFSNGLLVVYSKIHIPFPLDIQHKSMKAKYFIGKPVFRLWNLHISLMIDKPANRVTSTGGDDISSCLLWGYLDSEQQIYSKNS